MNKFFKNTLEKPFIIAEIGSNWRDLEGAFKCIEMAKEAGATAVKFQMFTHLEMYGVDGKDEFALPRTWIPKLADKAMTVGIEFMCSTFSESGFALVDRFVKTHKIASSSAGNMKRLIQAKKTKKPTLISDGMFDVPKDVPFIPMLCCSKYPAFDYEYDLFKMYEYAASTGGCWGLSDHTPGSNLLKICRSHGCSYFELHANFIDLEGTPDSGWHSCSKEAFADYVKIINGTKVGGPMRIKSEAREKWGEKFDKQLNGYYRPRL